jgi:membrane protease YdiL (CAAX protease family)
MIAVVELALALIFFALPPLFTPAQSPYVVPAYYNTASLLLFALASAWLLASRRGAENRRQQPALPLAGARQTALYAGICAVMLAVAGALTQELSKLTGTAPETLITGGPQAGLWFFANNIFGALVSASFEEILYRVFLPSRLVYFKVPEYAAWAISLVLFALAHRPLGLWGMTNALLCGAALHYCYQKTASVPVICALHTAYNLAGRWLLLRF